jgi:ABC-2 type transport system permease protein
MHHGFRWVMTLRYCYLLRSSWPRTLELIYWPAMQMLIWGFLQIYLSENQSSFAAISGTFVGAVLLWDVLFRGQLGFSISFMEEIWSRNIANLMISPLRPGELAASLMVISVVRLLIGMIPVSLLAFACFNFNIYGLGLALIAFFMNLILVAWAIGLGICGLVLRYGMGAESLAWSLVMLLLPVCGVYYPVRILPQWLQPVSWSLVPTYVFEGLRAILLDHVFRADLMLRAGLLNSIYLTLGLGAFVLLLQNSRERGTLTSIGE